MNRPKLMAPKHFLLLTTGVPAAIVVLLVAFSVPQPSESAYTFQKINSMLPEMRQFFGRTHLGSLRIRPFHPPAEEMQFRERKSNNLRNLMRIGKRSPVAIQQQRREPPIDPSLVMNAFPAISAVENLLVPTFHTGSSSSSSSSTSQQQSARIFSKKIFHYYRPQSIWIK